MATKHFVCTIFFISIFCFGQFPDAGHAGPPNGPRAVLPEIHAEFAPVFEGQPVRHAFVVQNKGDAPLDILDVRTD